MNLPEPARALGWHLLRAALVIAVAAAVLVYGAILILTVATALAGYGPWWIPALMLAGLALPIGGVTWWRAGMGRPGSRDRECQCPTISASEILRGELRANVKLGQP